VIAGPRPSCKSRRSRWRSSSRAEISSARDSASYVEGYIIDRRNPEAIKIAQSDDDRMSRIRKITDEMRHLQEQKNEALRMKLRKEVDAKMFREVTAEIDAAHDQLARVG